MRPSKPIKIDAQAEPEEPVPAAKQRALTRGRNPELEVVLGARIRAARIGARMSQSDLGAAVGISFQQVQKYEKGADRIAASTLQGFATALGVHPGSFFGDDMPVPSGSIPDVKAAMRIAKSIQRVRDPVVVKRLLALVDLLAETDGAEDGDVVEHPTSTRDEPN